jgi:hypothetical protein
LAESSVSDFDLELDRSVSDGVLFLGKVALANQLKALEAVNSNTLEASLYEL